MELLSPNSLPPTRLLQTLEQSRVRVFPTYKSGAPNPTLRRFWSPRLSRRAPPSMAAALSSHENNSPVATPKSRTSSPLPVFSSQIGSFRRVFTLHTDSLLWQALLQALGDRKGIYRFGHFAAPLDEAAIEVILVYFCFCITNLY
ncbi:hypothetical protein B296_00057464 [Ensete ventricosum]|uniref:Uncharacterized protein n=1 Tax=Ensete ventricosum TaxID=4639 RepID=A0A426XFP0_ENSVE|nr:hypothetical protein B296_00057464 [Ensete ventricosum]